MKKTEIKQVNMMEHGGKRAGAGRKKKDRSGQEFFDGAQSYLLAVVQGRTVPDSVRVMAAKTLIQYETAKQRAPVQSPAPAKLREKTHRDIEKNVAIDFEKKAAKIREKYQKGVK